MIVLYLHVCFLIFQSSKGSIIQVLYEGYCETRTIVCSSERQLLFTQHHNQDEKYWYLLLAKLNVQSQWQPSFPCPTDKIPMFHSIEELNSAGSQASWFMWSQQNHRQVMDSLDDLTSLQSSVISLWDYTSTDLVSEKLEICNNLKQD